MTVPLIGQGHDLALGALSPFVIEPQISEGVHTAQRDVAADGSVHTQGLFCTLVWPVIDGVDDLTALLTQLGLEQESDLRTAVTAYLPTTRRNWHLYNAWALAPSVIRYAFWPSDLRIVLTRLVEIG